MKIAQELRQGSTIKVGNDPFVVLRACLLYTSDAADD